MGVGVGACVWGSLNFQPFPSPNLSPAHSHSPPLIHKERRLTQKATYNSQRMPDGYEPDEVN